MNLRLLNEFETKKIITGEVITLTAVMAIAAIAIVAVIVYRLFMSEKGSTTLPGGFKFEWK
ncbi:MAG: hypothetical protein WCZ47_00705 [Bacilli bacterium]|jgi:hypothetical protein|nr:hypothetical protein [Bacilli bacterium]NLN80502.1 hypothetical protein [Erysipelotrichia bacterium]